MAVMDRVGYSSLLVDTGVRSSRVNVTSGVTSRWTEVQVGLKASLELLGRLAAFFPHTSKRDLARWSSCPTATMTWSVHINGD